ncbi:Sporulation kinase E [compost metagenome]
MSEATRKRMFEPFHTTKPKGTGLGLAVTHKILEGHGAQVQVTSEIGKGTEFVLRFPLAKQNA